MVQAVVLAGRLKTFGLLSKVLRMCEGDLAFEVGTGTSSGRSDVSDPGQPAK